MTATAPKALTVGLAAGVLGGLFGVGGGIIIVPGLVLWMGLSQHNASATSVTAIVATSSAALVQFAADGEVAWDIAGWLLLGGLTGAYLRGASLIERIPAVWLARAFCGPRTRGCCPDVVLVTALAFVAVGLLAGQLGGQPGNRRRDHLRAVARRLVLAMVQQEAQGTSLAVILPTALLAAYLHGRAGRVEWRTAILVGDRRRVRRPHRSQGGALAWRLPTLRRMFAVLLVITAIRMLRRITRASVFDRVLIRRTGRSIRPSSVKKRRTAPGFGRDGVATAARGTPSPSTSPAHTNGSEIMRPNERQEV